MLSTHVHLFSCKHIYRDRHRSDAILLLYVYICMYKNNKLSRAAYIDCLRSQRIILVDQHTKSPDVGSNGKCIIKTFVKYSKNVNFIIRSNSLDSMNSMFFINSMNSMISMNLIHSKNRINTIKYISLISMNSMF